MSLGRERINTIHRSLPRTGEIHPGLRLAYGLDEWPRAGSEGKKHDLLAAIADVSVPSFYRLALERWQGHTRNDARFYSFELALVDRMYIGVTRDNPVEAGVTVSHSYGMPIIPGSSVKGLTRASAAYLEKKSGTLRKDAINWLFGEGGDNGGSGGIYYHDAWWCGAGNSPFVSEIVTPHHIEYYGQEGKKAASDTDNPVPAAQIAVQGSFYFVLEGDPQWTNVAGALLKASLQQWGIGGKKSSGYGLFQEKS